MTTLRTNTNEFKKMYFKYILDSIESEDVELNTPEDKIRHFWQRFESEANYKYNRQRYPNLQKRVSEWLKGLPFSFHYSNYDIIELAKKHKQLPDNPTEKQENKILDNYYNFTAFKILQLSDKLKIEYSHLNK